MNKINYYLVLEKIIGDYNIIDINKLDIIDRYYSNSINDIDLFTTKYSINDIKDSIRRANLVKEEYLNGNFKIISDKKHHLDIINKDMFNIIKDFQNNDKKIDNNFKNKLYGSYKKIIDKNFNDIDFKKSMLSKFNEILKNGNKHDIFKNLEELPYENIREFYITIYKELNI